MKFQWTGINQTTEKRTLLQKDLTVKSDNSLFGYYFIETDVLLTLDKKTNLEYYQTKKQRVKISNNRM